MRFGEWSLGRLSEFRWTPVRAEPTFNRVSLQNASEERNFPVTGCDTNRICRRVGPLSSVFMASLDLGEPGEGRPARRRACRVRAWPGDSGAAWNWPACDRASPARAGYRERQGGAGSPERPRRLRVAASRSAAPLPLPRPAASRQRLRLPRLHSPAVSLAFKTLISWEEKNVLIWVSSLPSPEGCLLCPT